MKVIDYIELLSYGKYDYYDTKFSINNTGIKGNFTMNDFCQRLALTEEVLNMEIEIIEDTPKHFGKEEKQAIKNIIKENSVTLKENYLDYYEDIPKEDKKIEDKARFQYSQIPSWFDTKELIKVVNSNFERHQKALNEIIDKINKGGK